MGKPVLDTGSSVCASTDITRSSCREIPKGTVGIVQGACAEGKIKVKFGMPDGTVAAKVSVCDVEKQRFFTVLSIDGGGIRGIIPALILAHIEAAIKARLQNCQLRNADFFDLIAGTSTGGIIALALATRDNNGRLYTAADLVRLYQSEGGKIFHRSAKYRLRSGSGWLNNKYPQSGIEAVLERYFGNTRLREAATRVLIPSYDMRGARVHWRNRFDHQRGGHPRFFKSYAQHGSRDSDNPAQQQRDYLMRDVARATSAAPTYFEPVDLNFNATNRLELVETLVDGGIFANNPAMCAYADARKMLRADGEMDKKILLISLGTGNLTGKLEAGSAKDWGKLAWVDTLIKMIFDGASDTVDYQLRQLLSEVEYYRFQPQLTFGNDDMDDAGEVNLLELSALADIFIQENHSRLDTLIGQLVHKYVN